MPERPTKNEMLQLLAESRAEPPGQVSAFLRLVGGLRRLLAPCSGPPKAGGR